MIKRNIKAIAFASLTAAILLTAFSASPAQSGGASLHGWVAFENVAYVNQQPRAKVVLQHDHLVLAPHIQQRPTSTDSLRSRTPALADSSWRSRPRDFSAIPSMFTYRRTLPATGLFNSKRKRRSALDRSQRDYRPHTTDHRLY